MELNTLDILVLLKVQTLGSEQWTQAFLAKELYISQSQVHTSLSQAEGARLYIPSAKCVSRKALAELLIHGVKYVFPPYRGGLIRGIPTSYAAKPLYDHVVQPDSPPPVWPHVEGTHKGYEFSPLDKRAPKAALRDPSLYELLVLIDAIRDGRPRETKIAVGMLNDRLGQG